MKLSEFSLVDVMQRCRCLLGLEKRASQGLGPLNSNEALEPWSVKLSCLCHPTSSSLFLLSKPFCLPLSSFKTYRFQKWTPVGSRRGSPAHARYSLLSALTGLRASRCQHPRKPWKSLPCMPCHQNEVLKGLERRCRQGPTESNGFEIGTCVLFRVTGELFELNYVCQMTCSIFGEAGGAL